VQGTVCAYYGVLNPMAVRAGQSAPDGPGSTDKVVAGGIILLLVLVPLGVWFFIGNAMKAAPSQEAVDIGSLNTQNIFDDGSSRFLPTPVAALPAEINAGPPAPAADEQTAADTAPTERVKIANTGGVGAILRADPPKGRQVAALRDGTILQVLEHRQVDDGADWLRVRTPDGTEGWVFSRLVAASD
jgi:Bacterial SH3 domain